MARLNSGISQVSLHPGRHTTRMEASSEPLPSPSTTNAPSFLARAGEIFNTLRSASIDKSGAVLNYMVSATIDSAKFASKETLILSGQRVAVKDPMFDALYDDLLQLESVILNIESSTVAFLKGLDTLGESNDLLTNILLSNTIGHPAQFQDALMYRQAVQGINVGGVRTTARGILEESLQTSVMDPLREHLSYMRDIKNRLKKLSTLNTSIPKLSEEIEVVRFHNEPGAAEAIVKLEATLVSFRQEKDALYATLFDELTFLRDNKVTMVVTLFDALKRAQFHFFENAAKTILPTLGEPPKAPASRKSMLPKEVEVDIESIVDPSRKAEEIERRRRTSLVKLDEEESVRHREEAVKAAIDAADEEKRRRVEEMHVLREEEAMVRSEGRRMSIDLAEAERDRRLSEDRDDEVAKYREAMRKRVGEAVLAAAAGVKE